MQKKHCACLKESNTAFRSPFKNEIVLDWWDGPIVGLMRCKLCDNRIIFRALLEQKNDTINYQSQSMRMYALTILDQKEMSLLLGLLSGSSEPTATSGTVRSQPPKDWSEDNSAQVSQFLSEINRSDIALITADLEKLIICSKKDGGIDIENKSSWPVFVSSLGQFA